MKTCQTCKHWCDPYQKARWKGQDMNLIWKQCELLSPSRFDTIKSTAFSACVNEGIFSEFYTAATFGCNQHETAVQD